MSVILTAHEKAPLDFSAGLAAKASRSLKFQSRFATPAGIAGLIRILPGRQQELK